MAENLSERENVVEPADTAGSLESPGDVESAATESGRINDAIEVDTVGRDASALRRGDPDAVLSAGDISQQPGMVRRTAETDPTKAATQAGDIPHATVARIRNAQAAQRRAAHLGEHEVAQATAAAWNLLGGRAGGMDGVPIYGRTDLVAASVQVSSESAQTGLMQATLARMAEMSMRGGVSGPDQPREPADGPEEGPADRAEQDDQATDTEQSSTGPSEKVRLTGRLNDLRYELSRPDRELDDEERDRLQAEHDTALSQLRDVFRDEMRTERAATSDALRDLFRQQEVDPAELSQELAAISGVLGDTYESLVAAHGEDDPRTQAARERFEKSQIGVEVIYLYTRHDAPRLVTSFPDHDPTETELAAMELGEREREFAKQLAAHGTGSWQAQRALDAAYEAHVSYRALRQRGFESTDDEAE